ncbi:MAG: hypothetical protein P9M14_12950 [Candidatus Alcyoniella australis]|nr:hypothetical protein [Candidatus Alcyoniella australis]
MLFHDETIDGLISQNDSVDAFIHLIYNDFCGNLNILDISPDDKCLIEEFIKVTNDHGLDYPQFNELLLLLNQKRISEGFFHFLFNDRLSNIEDLKNGIISFRGFAFLSFGQFFNAFEHLRNLTLTQLQERLKPFSTPRHQIEHSFKTRHDKVLKIKRIDKSLVYYNGFITKEHYTREAKLLKQFLEERRSLGDYGVSPIDLEKEYNIIGKDIELTEKTAKQNTDIYLTWDFLDIYISTSMRQSWEFRETYEFIDNLFSSSALSDLNLRYFDPTQSLCLNRIDKGLIEGLMLKRASCNIYMVQEFDTMGKDSELAATLAQGKPVIAYVPQIQDLKQFNNKIIGYPLDYHYHRCIEMQTQSKALDKDYEKEMISNGCDASLVDDFITLYLEHRDKYPFSLYRKDREIFLNRYDNFSQLCTAISIFSKHMYDKRAKTLKSIHPLSVQIHLESGVANGILVVRDPDTCSKLLRKILLNDLEFQTEYVGKKPNGVWALTETISGCPFRVVTENRRLTNSFWNFYLNS